MLRSPPLLLLESTIVPKVPGTAKAVTPMAFGTSPAERPLTGQWAPGHLHAQETEMPFNELHGKVSRGGDDKVSWKLQNLCVTFQALRAL